MPATLQMIKNCVIWSKSTEVQRPRDSVQLGVHHMEKFVLVNS